ncbi:N-glycosylase/DNA lyase OGG1 [Juglans microcarpa x Juglans regia]|uniref:N-glycosylase/DNA lyase OGG1 n=1 Tax=Juglans microcarpa x Juglans regia TaxID=2249226 RepID=UPI001B7F09C5|nr:N-glycosylase/DNA lyase OGG1 [Juglans microcarpa x Juglans regia]XP_040997332.1 N-glycosylase/DNA lyase OGG1 [Juglans microcarpa x Juglans regia]XP_040997333.1 N-glycosylase/DNA lyase OGG1 [Juglans microcarpa x Juglans regia]
MHSPRPSSLPIMKRSRPTPPPTPPLSTAKSTAPIFKKPKSKAMIPPKWVPLGLSQSELSLPLTFPTGQTFRWKQTGPLQYTGVVDSYLISLKHLQDGEVSYCFHHHATTGDENNARVALLDFLNMRISLSEIWEVFSASDPRFAELARHLGGARVLRQDPLECLIQFLCSSNNNITRITKMVNFISSLGNCLGTVEGFEFYQFPGLERLAMVSEDELREAGFGYRAKYIIGTVNALQSKPGGGTEWLASLRNLDLHEVIDALSTLPGVGPKVAACIALFSLDQHHAIPVDTHVWQIATRYLLPELAGARLTPRLCSRVAEAFVSKYGKYAGWAQTLLFIAELPSQKALLPSQFCSIKEKKAAKSKNGKTCSAN